MPGLEPGTSRLSMLSEFAYHLRTRTLYRARTYQASPFIVNMRFYHESQFKNALELFADLTTKTCLFKYLVLINYATWESAQN